MSITDIQPIGATMVEMLPWLCSGIVACFLLLLICKRVSRHQDAHWKAGIAHATAERQFELARRGMPSDRLFGRVLTAIGGIACVLLFSWMQGWTPATTKEREFIELVAGSEYAATTKVRAALGVVGNAWYVSRADFHLVADAIGHL